MKKEIKRYSKGIRIKELIVEEMALTHNQAEGYFRQGGFGNVLVKIIINILSTYRQMLFPAEFLEELTDKITTEIYNTRKVAENEIQYKERVGFIVKKHLYNSVFKRNLIFK